ncbi:DUF6002 family protein [Streptomyces spiramyceticus]|uniref:DUF6002 family protein n=1 Tax=Streptomyces spiramyceticus TaxID=299717 RepID=UPI00237A8A9A|nr:DUF6002 family protein [Streptomyces spiramyceticus]
MTTSVADATIASVNVLGDHGEQLRQALTATAGLRPPGAGFEPAFALPEPTDRLAEFFAVTDLRFAGLGTVGDTRLVLLDLMGNPGTRTVKTLASHVIVARAVRHIDSTGEAVMILTPSSANKATALRDAVLRAYRTGLATPGQLRIVTVVPDAARPKLWQSDLDDDPYLAARNPMCVLDREHPEHVKTVAVQAMEGHERLFNRYGFRLWHTLDLDNYRCADAVRAFAEDAALPLERGAVRVHAHAVSSAFGLLGHHFGTTLLPERPAPPQYFLVQHLATPDMVQSLYGTPPPEYRADAATGLYHQDEDPRYPYTTFSPAEELETTFYTRTPTTSRAMNEIIRANGGGGVVVSLHECLTRYGEIRALLARGGTRLPADPRALREWSLAMVTAGVLNGIDRGLIRADEVVVHASGSYGEGDFAPLPERSVRDVGGAEDVRRAVLDAAAAGTG